MVADHKGGVDHEVIQGDGHQGHTGRAQEGTQQRAAPRLAGLVHGPRRQGEHRPQGEVAQLPHVGGGGALKQDVQQVLQQRDGHAVAGTQREGRQQLRQVGDVHLHKKGHQGRNGEFQEHQREGHGGEHGGDGQFVGPLPDQGHGGGLHKNTLLCSLGTPWSLCLLPGEPDSKEASLARRGFAVFVFSHPDFHCWSRNRAGSADAPKGTPGRGLYRQWGIAPRPEDKDSVVLCG